MCIFLSILAVFNVDHFDAFEHIFNHNSDRHMSNRCGTLGWYHSFIAQCTLRYQVTMNIRRVSLTAFDTLSYLLIFHLFLTSEWIKWLLAGVSYYTSMILWALLKAVQCDSYVQTLKSHKWISLYVPAAMPLSPFFFFCGCLFNPKSCSWLLY